MGVAAYWRGSRCISRGLGLIPVGGGLIPVGGEDVHVTPRPAGWGGKVRAKADKRAAGLLRYWTSNGRDAPSVEDLADMVQMGMRVGRETAEQAASAALGDV